MKTCGKAGCEPREQVRGQCGPGDYYDIIESNKWLSLAGVSYCVQEPEKYGVALRPDQPHPPHVNQRHLVEINENNENDFRICCKMCGKATGWQPKDIPGMPDGGAIFVRKQWDDQCPE